MTQETLCVPLSTMRQGDSVEIFLAAKQNHSARSVQINRIHGTLLIACSCLKDIHRCGADIACFCKEQCQSVTEHAFNSDSLLYREVCIVRF